MNKTVTLPDEIPHPSWCLLADSNPLSDVGPIEPDWQHRSDAMSLDCGEQFSWTVSVNLNRLYEFRPSTAELLEDSDPSIELRTRARDVVSEGGSAFLTIPEARRVIAMLEQAIHTLEVCEVVQ